MVVGRCMLVPSDDTSVRDVSSPCSDQRLTLLRSPTCSSQRSKLGAVLRVDVTFIINLADHVEDDAHQDTANGMNGLVPIEPFIHKTLERRRGSRRITHCNLIFDEHVRCPVKLCAFAEREVIATVVFDDHLDVFGFIKRKPSLRIGLLNGIVEHGVHLTFVY
jgi:hypothetical protein